MKLNKLLVLSIISLVTTTLVSCDLVVDMFNSAVDELISEVLATSSEDHSSHVHTTENTSSISSEITSNIVVSDTSEVTSNGTSTSENLELNPKELSLSGTSNDQEGNLEVYFFQLENISSTTCCGDAIYINYGNIDILIDAGLKNVGTNVVTPYLSKHVKDNVIELCINTHTDADHLGGFLGTKSNGNYTGVFSLDDEIKYFIDSGFKASTELYSNYKEELDKRIASGTTYYSYESMMTDENSPSKFILGPDTYIDVLNTKMFENNFAGSSDVNDYSVPIILHHGENTFLLMGDCEKKAEAAALLYNELPEVDVFKANHHGSPTSNTSTFLDVIKPKYVIIDSTANNQYNLPKKEIVDRFLNYTTNIYTPFINGGIHIYSDKKNITFKCDGYRDYTVSTSGPVTEGTDGEPIKLQTTKWYQGAV